MKYAVIKTTLTYDLTYIVPIEMDNALGDAVEDVITNHKYYDFDQFANPEQLVSSKIITEEELYKLGTTPDEIHRFRIVDD